MLNNLTKLLANSKSSTINNQTVVYNFNKNRSISVNTAKENATVLLKYFFASISCLIGKPVFKISPNKVVIHLCFYKPGRVEFDNDLVFSASSAFEAEDNISSFYGGNTKTQIKKGVNKPVNIFKPNFKYLGYMLSQLFNKEVELELIPLQYPYHDSNILAQLIGLNSNKYNFNRMLKTLFNKAYILTNKNSSLFSAPLYLRGSAVQENEGMNSLDSATPTSQLTGIKIKIAGRLATQRIVPKATVKTAYKGSLSSSLQGKGKIQNNFVDSAKYTSKNKIGAYTVTVSLGHKIIN